MACRLASALRRAQILSDCVGPQHPVARLLIDPDVIDLESLRKGGGVDAVTPGPFRSTDREVENNRGVSRGGAVVVDPFVGGLVNEAAIDEETHRVVAVP